MIGSALKRGSLIVVFDQHGTTLFSKARGQDPTTDCWDLLVPPSPHATARSSIRTTKRTDETGMTVYAKAA